MTASVTVIGKPHLQAIFKELGIVRSGVLQHFTPNSALKCKALTALYNYRVQEECPEKKSHQLERISRDVVQHARDGLQPYIRFEQNFYRQSPESQREPLVLAATFLDYLENVQKIKLPFESSVIANAIILQKDATALIKGEMPLKQTMKPEALFLAHCRMVANLEQAAANRTGIADDHYAHAFVAAAPIFIERKWDIGQHLSDLVDEVSCFIDIDGVREGSGKEKKFGRRENNVVELKPREQ